MCRDNFGAVNRLATLPHDGGLDGGEDAATVAEENEIADASEACDASSSRMRSAVAEFVQSPDVRLTETLVLAGD